MIFSNIQLIVLTFSLHKLHIFFSFYTVPPVIIKRYGSPEEHRTSEFIPITFYCLLHDINQTKAEITWTKDGSPILMSPDGDYFVIQDQGQSLTVVRPTGDEVGTYRCLAKNRAGEDSHSFQLSVIGKQISVGCLIIPTHLFIWRKEFFH